jgi:hypothetical protein
MKVGIIRDIESQHFFLVQEEDVLEGHGEVMVDVPIELVDRATKVLHEYVLVQEELEYWYTLGKNGHDVTIE